MQLDAEDAEGFGQAHPPAGVIAATLLSDPKAANTTERPDSQGTETDARAAAEGTREIEE